MYRITTGKGCADLDKAANGEVLTPMRAIRAKCAECLARYADGRYDCEMPKCPLYPYMPYKDVKMRVKSEDV